MALTFGDQEIEGGDAAWVDLSITDDADMHTIRVPSYVINGSAEGPTLWLQAGLHGPEQVPMLALRDFLLNVDPEEVAGTIIGIPVVNVTAFAAKRRTSPLDDVDLNRAFPGSRDGTFTEQLARKLFSVTTDHADYVVDMHSGGNELFSPGWSIFPGTGDVTEEDSRELCEITELPYALKVNVEELSGAMYAELGQRGIPAILTETGGEGKFHRAEYERATRLLRNITRHLNILPGEYHRETEVSIHEGVTYMTSSTGGFFSSTVRTNEVVREGESMGEITTIKGETIETFEAPYDLVMVGIRTFATARPGDKVFEYTPL